jgi:hypothetical protein
MRFPGHVSRGEGGVNGLQISCYCYVCGALRDSCPKVQSDEKRLLEACGGCVGGRGGLYLYNLPKLVEQVLNFSGPHIHGKVAAEDDPRHSATHSDFSYLILCERFRGGILRYHVGK